MIIDFYSERMAEEVDVVPFRVLSNNLPEETSEYHEQS